MMASSLNRKNSIWFRVALIMVCSTVILTSVFGTTKTTQAAGAANSQTIVVMRRLILWRSPTLRSRIVAVLLRGRHFTVDGQSASGLWLHGVTDRGTRG